uniref:Secreted protein n=1 Tax=Trypanosoma vivax (strain Y486) TaxID=1055687 RepID=G0TYI0_TRYVY|nr:hypothetical protein, unlikely [Trypanosoma vivax Y486]
MGKRKKMPLSLCVFLYFFPHRPCSGKKKRQSVNLKHQVNKNNKNITTTKRKDSGRRGRTNYDFSVLTQLCASMPLIHTHYSSSPPSCLPSPFFFIYLFFQNLL